MSALHLYVQDYDETFTIAYLYSGGFWYQVIAPYVKNTQIFVEPSMRGIG